MDRRASRFLGLGLLVLLAGCVSVAAYDAYKLAGVRNGEEAIVMMRFTVADQNGTQIAPFAFGLAEDNLGLAIGDFDTGGVTSRHLGAIQFPTAAARDEGFVYVILRPGFYYLAIQGARRADAFSYAAGFQTKPRWRIEVPQGVPVLYAGSFMLSGTSERLLLGNAVIASVDHAAARVVDETARARIAVSRDLPDFGAPVPRFAVRHAGPIMLGIPPPKE